MSSITFEKNQTIASQRDKVKNWYIILEGTVIQKNGYARIPLGKDSVIGISEDGYYLCDYVAGTNVLLAVYPYESPKDLAGVIKGQESMRRCLLRAALTQRQLLLKTYSGYQNLAAKFHYLAENLYNEYTNFCQKYNRQTLPFSRIGNFLPIEMVHRAESWEIDNSASLTSSYMESYIELMQKDDALCIGAILEAARQSKRVTQGIIEMVEYLTYNQDILLSENANDIFHLYYDLLTHLNPKRCELSPLLTTMDHMIDVIGKVGLYSSELVSSRQKEYDHYKENGMSANTGDGGADDGGERENYLLHILNYAELDREKIEEITSLLKEYHELPDMLSTDSDVHRLRRKITTEFFDTYYKVFMRSITEPGGPTPIVQMFLNFGFMDEDLAGTENTNMLYNLTSHLNRCSSNHVYTIYTWLKSVYEGRNVPSKNEFDLDFPAYLLEQRKTGQITAAEAAEFAEDPDMKLKFEIQNMFTSGNRATYGKISTYCPVLCEMDLINSVDKMLVTVQRLEDAIFSIRQIDFSVFYREVPFSDPENGINMELIQKEVFPDIILMPNAGTRAMMWQELGGKKRDTSARFLFPIFTAVDINDMMIDTVGRYRWEICRRIQGVHWNDIREKSLTAEYCDYIQFYKKNHDLSAEAKEKIKLALQRGRNNYREVFVRDYQNWINFEAKGSFRLNKISRDILLQYCPFSKQIREELKSNPVYQNAWQRFDVQNAKALQRVNGVYSRYLKAGGTITPELQENLDYYSL